MQFSVDGWIYMSSYNGKSDGTGKPNFIGTMNPGTAANDWSFGPNNSGNLVFYYDSNFITSTSTIPLNVWNHIAFTRDGSDIRIFINGDLEQTATVSGGGCGTADSFTIGAYNGTNFSGKIDEIRVVAGSAVWTDSFDRPFAPYALF